jgi:chromosome segregation ATPase
MTNNMSDREFDADEFLDWADRMAESEGVSTDKILDQIVSSYWVYTELQRTLNSVEDAPAANQSSREQETNTSSDTNNNDDDDIEHRQQPLPVEIRESEPDSGSDSAEDSISESDLNSDNESRKMSGERSEGELWQRLYELSDKLDQNRRSQTERWIRLRDRVESIEREVNMIENEKQKRGSDSSSENKTNMDNIQSDVDLLKQEIKQLKQSHEESIELRQEFKTRIEELEQSQETIQSRIDDEFDSIESAFETALTRQEKFETRRSQLTDQIEDNADTIDSMSEDRETLEAIRQTALEKGVENAKCGYCDESIKISMLASPECPFCETPLNDVDPGGWNPLNSDVLTGAPRDLSADESEEFNSFLDENTDTNGIS